MYACMDACMHDIAWYAWYAWYGWYGCLCVCVCLYVCACVSHMFRIQRGFTYALTCVAYTLHMHFTHALHTFHKVIMYVSYWFGTQITYVSHAFYIHMFCMRKRLRIRIRTPSSGAYRRSLEAFWDSAKFYNESEQGPLGTCNVRMSVCNVT